jgi:hypothetical protein
MLWDSEPEPHARLAFAAALLATAANDVTVRVWALSPSAGAEPMHTLREHTGEVGTSLHAKPMPMQHVVSHSEPTAPCSHWLWWV